MVSRPPRGEKVTQKSNPGGEGCTINNCVGGFVGGGEGRGGSRVGGLLEKKRGGG